MLLPTSASASTLASFCFVLLIAPFPGSALRRAMSAILEANRAPLAIH